MFFCFFFLGGGSFSLVSKILFKFIISLPTGRKYGHVPDEQLLFESLMRNYQRSVRPVSNASSVVLIKFSLHINQIIDLVSTILSHTSAYWPVSVVMLSCYVSNASSVVLIKFSLHINQIIDLVSTILSHTSAY